MKHRPILYLLIVITVAAVVLVLDRPDRVSISDHDVVAISHIDSAKVTKIAVSQILSGVVLEKRAGKWAVTTAQTPMAQKLQAQDQTPAPEVVAADADPQKIAHILEMLADLKSRSVIGDNPDHYAQFQVNDMGTHVQAWDAEGKVLADIYLGKMGPDLVSTCVRRQGDPLVYLVSGYLQFPADITHWEPKAKEEPPAKS